MSETLVHVTLYVKNEEATDVHNEHRAGYDVDDNDPDVLFSPIIFPECLVDWHENRGQIIKVPADLIRDRLDEKCQTTVVPPLVISKIEAIIKFIEKHGDNYIGVVTVF
jgi:hypothetical protein